MPAEWIRRFKRFLHREEWEAERAQEIAAHLEMEADEQRSRGLPPAAARFAAHRRLGNAIRIQEEIYYMNSLGWVETIGQDLRYALRLLRHNPGFAAAAILSLALGIGANTALFELLNAVRLRTLPVRDPQELAHVMIDHRNGATGNFTSRYPEITQPQWELIRLRQQGFSGMLAWSPHRMNLAPRGEVRRIEGLFVSGDFFNVLEVRPYAGRLFTPGDDRPGCGAASGAVISYSFWQRELGGAADVLSRAISLEGQLFPIIGITPEDFYGVEVGRNFDVAVPLCAEPLLRGEDANYGKRDGWWLSLLGRLRPGWNMAQAAAQLRSISPEIFKETLPPKFDTDDAKHYLGYQLGAFPAGTGLSELRRDYENPLWLLLGLAALVLLIACANLANLMLARAAGREREFGVRLVVGASRVRLVRQLLAESLLLAAIGAGVGAWIARGLSRFLVAFLSTSHNPLFMDLRADGRVFGFTAALAVFTCLLFGLIPALRATALAPADALRSGGRNSTAGRERFGLRRALVSAQVALTLVLLVGALLFSRSLRNLAMVDAGFREQGILIADFDTTPLKLPPAERLAFRQRLLERVRGVPGVLAAAETRIVPLSGNGWNRTVDAKSPGAGKTTTAQLNRISPDYFRTMETPLLAGRDFDQRDAVGAPKVAIVNQTFARVFLGEENPVGKSFQFKVETGAPEPVFQIVGLVRDSKYSELREDSVLIAYFPMAQDEQPSLDSTFVIRSALPPNSLRSALRSPFEEASPEIQISFQVMDTMVQQTMLRERLMATLSGFFGLLAGVLATIGIYGVISYTVAQRRGEFGIRMALGADRGRIVSMILGEAAVLLGVGLTAGTVITLLAVRAVGSMLFGLRPDDPPTLLIAVALLAVVGAAASCFPAVRASRLDPTEALRAE